MFVFLVLYSQALSNEAKKNIYIFSSQPDYTLMNLITADFLWQDIIVAGGKNFKYTSFRNAY